MGLTLEQRAILLHRKFPEVKITRGQLWWTYHKNGVSRKAIRRTKLLTPVQKTKLQPQVEQLRDKFREALAAKRSIIYIDEVMFT